MKFRSTSPTAAESAVMIAMHMHSDMACVRPCLDFKIAHAVTATGSEVITGWLWRLSDDPTDTPLLSHTCCVSDGFNEITTSNSRTADAGVALEQFWI